MKNNLLETYWEGKTSLQEEEQLLRDQSQSSGPEAAYFAMIAEARKQKSRLTAEDIHQYNQRQIRTSAPVVALLPMYRWIASAAAILVFVLAGIGLWNYTRQVTEPVHMAETFDDPYKAYEEVRQALAFMSSKLNQSQSQALSNIKKAGEYADMFK